MWCFDSSCQIFVCIKTLVKNILALNMDREAVVMIICPTSEHKKDINRLLSLSGDKRLESSITLHYHHHKKIPAVAEQLRCRWHPLFRQNYTLLYLLNCVFF